MKKTSKFWGSEVVCFICCGPEVIFVVSDYRDKLLDVRRGGGRYSLHRVRGPGPLSHEVTLL